MAWRGNLTKKPVLAVAGSLAALGCAAIIVFQTLRQRPLGGVPTQAYFYDLETDHVFAAPRTGPTEANRTPGAPGASGSAEPGAKIVLARVFSCGGCGVEAERFVGFLERHDPGQRGGRGTRQAGAVGGGVMVARPDAKEQWFAKTTAEGLEIVQGVMSMCGEGKTISGCTPPEP